MCPVCGNKTRLKIREDTELKKFPLYCPKCRQENLIECGFINHIDRITEACKQRNKSVYMLFWLFRTFLQSLFISNATNPPFTLGLRVKGDKRARLTSFPRQKGGEKHETIFFSDHNRKSV